MSVRKREDQDVLDPEDPDEEITKSAPSEEDKAAEARARAMGWIPEEEWDEERAKREGRKKPARFLSPADYIERTNNNLPILRETTRRLSEEVAAVRSENKEAYAKLDDIGKLVKSLYAQNRAVGQREYERGKAEAESIRRKAIEEGDVAAVDKADATLRSLEEIKPEATPVATDPKREEPKGAREPEKPKIKPEVKAWVDANPWFQKDPVLNAFVIDEHDRLMKEHPGIPEHELLDDAKKLAIERFPEKFDINPRRQAPGSVARPGPSGDQRNGKTSFRELSPELKADYKRQRDYMKEHNIEYTEQEFLDGLEKFGA